MNTFKITFYSLSIIVCAVLIIYGLNVFPVPGTDSIVFIPSALLFSKGYGLANPLYYVTQFTDPTHSNRFNYYVPFYSWLLGILSKIKPGVKTIFLFCSLFSVANLLLYARVITSFLPERTNTRMRILLLLSILYIATYLLPTVGRPENLTSLLVFLIYILYGKRGNYSQIIYNLFLCILFSLILATQLTCFYFCFLFFVTYELFYAKNIYRTIALNAIRLVAILTGFCILLAVSPNGLANTITGIKLHVSFVFTRSDRSIPLLVHYWLLAPLNFGFVFVFLLACIYYVKDLRDQLRSMPVVNRIVLIVVQVFIILGFIQFILYAAPTIYNATEFIMPISAYLISKMLIPAKIKFNNYFTTVALLTYLAGSLVFIRSIILFIYYKSDGKDYDHAQPLVSSLTKTYPGLYTTNSLWPLFDDLNGVRIFNSSNFKKGDVILVQQVNHSFPPALVNRCTILYDWNSAEENKFSGVRLANRPQGYGFVVCSVN